MFNKNLKYFRLRKGLTMRELADSVGVTSMAITNYEKGNRTPDMEILRKLAGVLGVNVMDLMVARNEELQFSHGAFRKNSTLNKARQELVRESIEEYFDRFYNIINILGECVLPAAPECGVAPCSGDDEDNARKMREWLQVAPVGPVGNLVNIVENNGILVYLAESDDAHFSGINGKIDGRPFVAINRNMNPERQRFTIVHELAHFYFSWQSAMDEAAREKKVDAIAGAFLFPRDDAFRELGVKRREIHNESLVAKEYGISMLCLAYRARELRIINEDAYRLFSIVASKVGWRKHEPARIPLEDSTLFRQLVYRAVAEDEISIQKGAELLKVPYEHVRKACAAEE